MRGFTYTQACEHDKNEPLGDPPSACYGPLWHAAESQGGKGLRASFGVPARDFHMLYPCGGPLATIVARPCGSLTDLSPLGKEGFDAAQLLGESGVKLLLLMHCLVGHLLLHLLQLIGDLGGLALLLA